MTPFFSVIIPLYNKVKYIEETIQSVLNQTYTNYEIIIVNDGSTDSSLNLVKSIIDKRISVFSIKNQGVSAARNFGIKKAASEFIALLDADDLWHELYLENIFKAINKHPNESVFAAAVSQKHNNKLINAKYSLSTTQEISVVDYFLSSFKHSILMSSSVVFRKEILKKTGLFDETMKDCGEDTDLWIRFGINYKIVFINNVLSYYVYETNSLSNTNFNIELKPRLDRYFEEEKNNKGLKKVLDLNRYSLALISKLQKNKKLFYFYKNHINLSNLSLKKQLLLHCNRNVLLLLLKIKSLKSKKLYYASL